MSLIGWNCQGAGAALTGRHLKYICNKYKPSLFFLSEIRANVSKVDRIRKRLGYVYAEYVAPVNTGGGLALWWKGNIGIQVIIKERHFFHVRVDSGMDPVAGFVTMVYGPQIERDRTDWWPRLKRLDPGEDVPWLCFGDFNELLSNSEKAGGRIRSEATFWDFQDFIEECNLWDMGAKGLHFTWSNHKENEAHIMERLDRALCSGA